jgi:hypothetical protein
MEKPNVVQAFNNIEVATRPENIYKLNRADFGNLNTSFEVVAAFIQAHLPKEEAPAAPVAEPKKRGPKPKTGGAFGAPDKPSCPAKN